MPKKKSIPMFHNEDEEREFWAEHDSADYVDWSKAKRLTLSKLKPSTERISIRIDAGRKALKQTGTAQSQPLHAQGHGVR